MSPLYRSLPIHNTHDIRNTENLHVFHVGVHALGEHARHVLNPEQAATRSMAQKVGGVETGLILDQELKFLVLDRLGYEVRVAMCMDSRTRTSGGSASRSCSGRACLHCGCA